MLTFDEMEIIANQLLAGSLDKKYMDKIKLLSSKFTSSAG
jgi:hypothetical protein